jgi:hypothetical protein
MRVLLGLFFRLAKASLKVLNMDPTVWIGLPTPVSHQPSRGIQVYSIPTPENTFASIKNSQRKSSINLLLAALSLSNAKLNELRI